MRSRPTWSNSSMMTSRIGWADIAICRAGAPTASELRAAVACWRSWSRSCLRSMITNGQCFRFSASLMPAACCRRRQPQMSAGVLGTDVTEPFADPRGEPDAGAARTCGWPGGMPRRVADVHDVHEQAVAGWLMLRGRTIMHAPPVLPESVVRVHDGIAQVMPNLGYRIPARHRWQNAATVRPGERVPPSTSVAPSAMSPVPTRS